MHDHAHPPDSIGGRLIASMVINVAITAMQLVGGVLSGSLALVADALHNLSDVAALGLSYFALRVSRRSPTRRYTFAFQRAEVLAALVNAGALLAVSAFVAFEAVQRLFAPSPVVGSLVVVFAAVGVVANAGAALLLRGHGSNLNIRAAVLHLVADSVASLGVLVAGAVIHYTGWVALDPIMSLALSAWMIKESVALLREAGHILMQGVPEAIELDLVESAISEVEGVCDVHDLHVWALASDNVILSAHLVLDASHTLTASTDVVVAVKRLLHDRFAVEHATLEVESCDAGCAGSRCAAGA